MKGFKLGKAKLVFDKLLLVPILPRKNSRPICPICGMKGPVYDTLRKRSWRHIAGFGLRVMIEYAHRRVKCRHCHKVVTEQMPWNLGKCQLTLPLIHQLAFWARELSWAQVARLFEVDWSQVKAAVEDAVQFGLERRDTDNISLLGIDEISRRKGHKYLTQVYEIAEDSKRLLWCGEGRSKETLRKFFQYWGEAGSRRIVGVCCDMWNPYISVVKEIVKHLNQAVDKVRRQEAAELRQQGNDILKNSRYVWLKNPENLTAKQQILFHQLAARSLKTHRAYELKRAFQTIWDSPDTEIASTAFMEWFLWAARSKLKPFRDIGWQLLLCKEHIISYFNLRINNSLVEGLNNKAKVVMRRSFGFHTVNTAKLALMHCLGKLELPDFEPQIHK